MAAHWWRMSLEKWDELDGMEQSRYMAVYRTHNQIHAIQTTKARKRAEAERPNADSPFRRK